MVEAALEDEIVSDEEDLNDIYTHIHEVKEYVDSIPVKKNLFIRQITLIKY